MKSVLAGLQGGKRVVNWRIVLRMGLVVGLVSGCSAVGMWYFLTKQFSLSIVLLCVSLSVGIFSGTAIRRAFSTPLEDLSILD